MRNSYGHLIDRPFQNPYENIGGFALRARLVPAALGLSTLLAASTAASAESAVPTGDYRRTRMIPTMRVLCGRMAMSTATTTTFTAIPTAFGATGLPNLSKILVVKIAAHG